MGEAQGIWACAIGELSRGPILIGWSGTITNPLPRIKHLFMSSSYMCFVLSDLKWYGSTSSSFRNHLSNAKENY
jgi:hypothetical protein